MTARVAPEGARTAAPAARHRARETAIQMLYQWEIGRMEMPDVQRSWQQTESGRHVGAAALSPAIWAFAVRLANGVVSKVDALDPLISEAASSWRIERMNVLDRLVLRLAVYEFLEEPDTPGMVIINEAIELARSFSSEQSVAFVNGVLDAIRRRLERA